MSLTFEVEINESGMFYERHAMPHRIGAPAEIYHDTDVSWIEYGDWHRVGGPALIHSHGIYPAIRECWVRGKCKGEYQHESEILGDQNS